MFQFQNDSKCEIFHMKISSRCLDISMKHCLSCLIYYITRLSMFHEIGCVLLRNRKHVPCFYRVIQTRVGVWENEKCSGNTSCSRVFPQLFRVLPNFHECLNNSIEPRSICFLFLLGNTATRKRKTITLLTLNIKM